MAVRGIDHDHIDVGAHKRLDALHDICRDADRGTAQETSLAVLGGGGIFDLLLYILDRDEALEIAFPVNDREFFLSRFAEDFLGFLERDALARRDESF